MRARPLDRRQRGASCPTTSSSSPSARPPGRCPIPGLAEHALGFKTLAEAIALRNRLLQTLEQAEVEDDPAVRARAAHLRVRRRRLRRRGGPRRAAGPRGGRHRALPALPARRRRASCSSRRASGSCRRSPPAWRTFAAAELRRRGMEIRTGTTSSASPSAPSRWPAARSIPSPHGGAGPRASSRIPVVARARAAARRRRPHRGRPLLPGRRPSGRLGDRRRRRRARPARTRAARRRRRPSTCCARARSWRDNVATALSGERPPRPFRYRTLGRVRRHGPQQGGGEHARHPLARLPGLVPRPHLPPRPHARQRSAGRGSSRTGRWGLLFGRDSAELGQLGHPPPLALGERSGGGTPPGDAPPEA